MNHAEQDLNTMLKVGYGCGLKTLDEAYNNLCYHYDAFFLIEEAGARLDALRVHYQSISTEGQTIRDFKGDEWCAEQDRLEEEYLSRLSIPEIAEEAKLGWAGMLADDEGDFLTGKTCNPNAPEECESCQ